MRRIAQVSSVFAIVVSMGLMTHWFTRFDAAPGAPSVLLLWAATVALYKTSK